MSEYRINIKIKNNLIMKKIESHGFDTVSQFCKFHKLSSSVIGELINLKMPPLDEHGEIRVPVKKLMAIFYCEFDDLFTKQQIKALPNNKYSFEASFENLSKIQNDSYKTNLLENDVLYEEMHEKIIESINYLTPREKILIERRFGLNGQNPHTLEECAALDGTQKERQRQIEAKALRKLRHPNISGELKCYADEMDGNYE